MSHPDPEDARGSSGPASVFAAIGDPTRLDLVNRLGAGRTCSISELTFGLGLTRQAVTKHLRVLEDAGLVRGTRSGREHRFALEPRTLDEARAYLERVGTHWDRALNRLKILVEKG